MYEKRTADVESEYKKLQVEREHISQQEREDFESRLFKLHEELSTVATEKIALAASLKAQKADQKVTQTKIEKEFNDNIQKIRDEYSINAEKTAAQHENALQEREDALRRLRNELTELNGVLRQTKEEHKVETHSLQEMYEKRTADVESEYKKLQVEREHISQQEREDFESRLFKLHEELSTVATEKIALAASLKAQKADQKTAQTEMEKDHEKFVLHLESKLKQEHELSLEKLNAEYAQNLQTECNKLSSSEEEKEQIHLAALKTLREEYDKKLQKSTETLRSTEQQLKEIHQKETSEMKAGHAAAVAKLKVQHEQILTALQSEKGEDKAQLLKLIEDQTKENNASLQSNIESLQKSHEQAIALLKEQQEKTLFEYRERLEEKAATTKQVETRVEQLQTEVKQLKDSHTSELLRLTFEHNAALEKIRVERQLDLSALSNGSENVSQSANELRVLQQIMTQHEGHVKSLSTQLDLVLNKHMELTSTYENQILSVEKEKTQLQAELSRIRELMSSSSKRAEGSTVPADILSDIKSEIHQFTESRAAEVAQYRDSLRELAEKYDETKVEHNSVLQQLQQSINSLHNKKVAKKAEKDRGDEKLQEKAEKQQDGKTNTESEKKSEEDSEIPKEQPSNCVGKPNDQQLPAQAIVTFPPPPQKSSQSPQTAHALRQLSKQLMELKVSLDGKTNTIERQNALITDLNERLIESHTLTEEYQANMRKMQRRLRIYQLSSKELLDNDDQQIDAEMESVVRSLTPVHTLNPTTAEEDESKPLDEADDGDIAMDATFSSSSPQKSSLVNKDNLSQSLQKPESETPRGDVLDEKLSTNLPSPILKRNNEPDRYLSIGSSSSSHPREVVDSDDDSIGSLSAAQWSVTTSHEYASWG